MDGDKEAPIMLPKFVGRVMPGNVIAVNTILQEATCRSVSTCKHLISKIWPIPFKVVIAEGLK